jgi:sugar phosphate isomerase/epimerase
MLNDHRLRICAISYRTRLGRGTVDFPALLGALEERGYRGYFTIPCNPIENPEFKVRQAAKYLRSL